jgi:hypothetical protein
VHRALSEPNNRISKLLERRKSNIEVVEELFLASLCRLPNDRERSAIIARVENARDRRVALEDVLAALLNCKEFLLRK